MCPMERRRSACCAADISSRGWQLFSHQPDWRFHLCSLCLYNRPFQRGAFLDMLSGVNSSHQREEWHSSIVLPRWVSSAALPIWLRALVVCFFFFSSCSHFLPHKRLLSVLTLMFFLQCRRWEVTQRITIPSVLHAFLKDRRVQATFRCGENDSPSKQKL